MEQSHDTLDEGDGRAVVLKDALLGLGVFANRLKSRLPAVHEMIGGEGVSKQLGGVALKFAENVRWKLVVLLAERRDPASKRKWSPVDEMRREAYEFFSRALADFGLLTS